MLAYSVAAFGVFIVLLGVAAAALPGVLRDFVRSVQSTKVLYGAVAARIVIGAVFIFASSTCSWPLAIGTIGVVILVAGFAGLFIGMQRIEALIGWFLKFSDNLLRAWAVIAMIFGTFIVYAAVL
jgi:hypothetical protein